MLDAAVKTLSGDASLTMNRILILWSSTTTMDDSLGTSRVRIGEFG